MNTISGRDAVLIPGVSFLPLSTNFDIINPP
jgi:hypothetical protein